MNKENQKIQYVKETFFLENKPGNYTNMIFFF